MKSKTLLFIAITIVLVPALLLGAVIQVAAGTDQISAAVAGATAGDIIELTTDGGVYNETAQVVIDKALTIRAAAGLTNPPVWSTDDAQTTILLGSSLTLEGIKLDGSLGANVTELGIMLQAGNLGYSLYLTGCEFCDFVGPNYKGTAIFADGDICGATQAELVEIIDCMFYRIPGNIIDFSYPDASVSVEGSVKDFYCANSTFQGATDDPPIYLARNVSGSGSVGDGGLEPYVTIDFCTFVNGGSKGIYPKYISGATIMNSIVAYFEDDAARIYGESGFLNFLWWSCPSGIDFYDASDPGVDASPANSTNIIEADPKFVDPDFATSGDFTLADDSPAVGQGDDGKTLGDPRWWPSTGVEINSDNKIPTNFQLHQNYPNPFNPTTTIGFDIVEAGHVTLTVYNMIGQEMTTLVDEELGTGHHEAKWNTDETVTTGVYFYKINTNGNVQIKKMMLLK